MNHNTPNQIILQIYDNKNSVILAQKHICKPVEQDGGEINPQSYSNLNIHKVIKREH